MGLLRSRISIRSDDLLVELGRAWCTSLTLTMESRICPAAVASLAPFDE